MYTHSSLLFPDHLIYCAESECVTSQQNEKEILNKGEF